MWFRLYWKVWFVKKVKGALWDGCAQHTENLIFPGWSAGGTLTRCKDKEVKVDYRIRILVLSMGLSISVSSQKEMP